MDSALLNFGNARKLCLFCLIRQKHHWNYFAFNQSYLAKGKIAPVVFFRQNKIRPISFCMGGSGLDRTVDFQKFSRSGLDRIQFYRIRTGLGLKNFTVRWSLLGLRNSCLGKCVGLGFGLGWAKKSNWGQWQVRKFAVVKVIPLL